MSRLARNVDLSKMWNSDNFAHKQRLCRENPSQEKTSEDMGSDSEGSSHESFPIHGLGDDGGYASRLDSEAYGEQPNLAKSIAGASRSSNVSELLAEPELALGGGQSVGEVAAAQAQVILSSQTTSERQPKKLLLRPYGTSGDATRKAQELQEAIAARQASACLGAGPPLEVGEQVSDLAQVCTYVDANSDFEVEQQERVLHRERTVDVRIKSSTALGMVVRKTYLEQTMHFPFRCHSSMEDQLLYEVSILRALQQTPGVTKLLGWCYNDDEQPRLKSLLFHFVAGNRCPTEPRDIMSYTMQLLKVLDHLHWRGIVHCNIKRENVLFDAENKLTVIDFETAVNEHELVDMGQDGFHNEQQVYYRSNPHFSAPEVLEVQPGRNKHGNGILYGHRRDVWGAGVILAELLLQMDEDTHLFSARRHRDERLEEREDFCERLKAHGTMLEAFHGLNHYALQVKMPLTMFHKHAADLVKHMTLLSRFERSRAWEALQHSFFSVDPEDTSVQPSFETYRAFQTPLKGLLEHEVVEEDPDDAYLHLHHQRSPSPDHSWRAMAGEGVAELARMQGMDDEMDPSDMYWYGKEGIDYLYSSARFY